MTSRIAAIVTIFVGLLVLAAPCWAAPCELLAGQPSTDLQACGSEAPSSGPGRHLSLDLNWAGPGVLQRVLDLRVPDVVALQVSQQPLSPAGQPQGPAQVLQTLGAASVYADRVLPSPRVAVPLVLPPGRYRISLDYQIHLAGRLYPLLEEPSAWRQRNAWVDIASGLQWGVMLTWLVLVMGSGLLAGEPAQRAYVALVLVHGVGLLEIRGYAFATLWPDSPELNQVATLVGVSLVMCTHAWFAAQFLRLRERMPRLYALHVGLMGLLALNLLSLPAEAAAARAGGLALAYALLALCVTWRSLRSGAPDLRLYVAGTGSYVVFTIVLFVLCGSGHHPWPALDHFLLPEVGYLLEATFLGAALLWRVRQSRQRQAQAREQQLDDARQLIQVEVARREANKRADRAALQFAGIGHDLMQPLASLRLALGALRPPPDQAPIAEHLDRTVAYAQTLLRDMLASGRSEHLAHDDRVMLGDCIARVVREHGAAAAAKGLQLTAVDTQLEWPASSLLLSRLLHNLVSNAVRYTVQGRILVGVRRRLGGLEIQVLDTGPGLMPEQLSRLTQPFQQGQAAAVEGHGLGLFIVRTLCEQHGYEFRVRSRVGRGSVFGVWMPLATV